MKKSALFVFFIFSGISLAFAQDSTATQNSLNSGTITSQFEYIYRVSNGFQEYEVVKKAHLEKLKSNVLDSVRTLSKQTSDLKMQMGRMDDSVAVVKQLLAAVQEEFEQHRKSTLDRERKLKRELVDAQAGRY